MRNLLTLGVMLSLTSSASFAGGNSGFQITASCIQKTASVQACLAEPPKTGSFTRGPK